MAVMPPEAMADRITINPGLDSAKAKHMMANMGIRSFPSSSSLSSEILGLSARYMSLPHMEHMVRMMEFNVETAAADIPTRIMSAMGSGTFVSRMGMAWSTTFSPGTMSLAMKPSWVQIIVYMNPKMAKPQIILLRDTT